MKVLYFIGLILLICFYKKLFIKKENFTNSELIKNNKKIILILGEQYWFNVDKEKIKESKILLNSLKNIKEYNIIISKEPVDFFNKLRCIEKNQIKFIFLFQDIIGDSFLNKIKIDKLYKYLTNLRDK